MRGQSLLDSGRNNSKPQQTCPGIWNIFNCVVNKSCYCTKINILIRPIHIRDLCNGYNEGIFGGRGGFSALQGTEKC